MKELNKNEMIENLLFEKYKNNQISNTRDFRKQINNKNVNVANVYRKIVNYQIDKFGRTLS